MASLAGGESVAVAPRESVRRSVDGESSAPPEGIRPQPRHRASRRTGWVKFLQQFNQPLVYILLLAVGVTAFLGEGVDSSVIFPTPICLVRGPARRTARMVSSPGSSTPAPATLQSASRPTTKFESDDA
jgi:hypothetical protein